MNKKSIKQKKRLLACFLLLIHKINYQVQPYGMSYRML